MLLVKSVLLSIAYCKCNLHGMYTTLSRRIILLDAPGVLRGHGLRVQITATVVACHYCCDDVHTEIPCNMAHYFHL